MEVSQQKICHGCLIADRKLTVLNNDIKKQCFLQIINEPSVPQESSVLLCWECEALVRKFNRFKTQAQINHKKLKKYGSKPVPNKGISNLHTHKLFNIHIPATSENTNFTEYEVIKTEEYNIGGIKEELDNGDGDDYADNTALDFLDCVYDVDIEKKKDLKQETEIVIEKNEDKVDKTVSKAEECTYRVIELTEKDIEKERGSLRSEEDYVNALFRCEQCILSFPNSDDLKDHIRIKHETHSHLKCKICECTFGTEVTYNYHMNKHIYRYECVVCAGRFPSCRKAATHFEVTHMIRSNLEYENLKKGKVQKLQTGIDESTKQAPSFPCEFCDKTFKWKTSLTKHLEAHKVKSGQKRQPYCEPCKLSFTTTSSLQKHLKKSSKHQIQLRLRKLKSQPETTSPERLEGIKSSVNVGRDVFPCQQCGARFQYRGNLLRHHNNHRAKAKGDLVCEPCNRTFSSIATYKQHFEISKKHVSENDFKYMCSDCGKRFPHKRSLRDHVDWEHLKNFVNKCPDCQKVFKSKATLYLHKRVVHQKNVTEYLCDHCGKAYTNRSKLKNHINAQHTSETPYACASCNARFSWSSCLSRHVRRVHHRAKDKLDNDSVPV
ncbi:zinc finger protein 91-like [Pectinophora gossypiella]|nr:zinc finger protein 91-like [Pectinophora gossypiella]